VAVKLSGAKHDQSEGYFTNTNDGDDNGRVDYTSFGANLLFTPMEGLEFEYTYQNEDTDQDTPPLLNVGQGDTLFCSSPDPRIGGHCAPDLNTPTSGDRFDVNTQFFIPTTASTNGIAFQATPLGTEVPTRGEATFDTETHIVEGHWDINDSYTVDYIFGHFETQETIISNWTAEPEMLFGTDRPAEYEQQSHELRLTYDAGGKLNFVLGGFLWDSEYDIRLRSWITFVDPTLVFDIAQITHQETESKAVFFEADYAITDALTLNVGGRYTKDEKISVQSLNQPGLGSEDWSEFTPKVGLRYQWTDDLLTYFTYTKGYRSGGFNGRVDSLETAEVPYDPEFVENFEGGFKSEWPDQNLRFNAAFFYMEYTDKQEEIGLPSTGATGQRITVFNAASATMKGVELEAVWAPTEGLTVSANLGYLDTGYDEFTFFDGFVTQDLSASEFRRAPNWTGSLDATYEWEVGSGQAWVRGAYHFIDDHFVEQTNRPELKNDGSHLIDLSANYAMNNGVTVSVYGRNLTDEDTYAHGLNVSGLWAYASPRPPRTWGVEVGYSWGN
jgi:iron complex outermembrane receptor protein